MNALWSLTICANLLLLAALAVHRRRFPIAFGSQVLVIAMSAMLLWAFYSPSVDAESYHTGWIASDQLCILCGGFSSWEILERGRRWIRLAGWLLIAHTLFTLWSYMGNDSTAFYDPQMVRVWSNFAVTLALAGILFSHKEHYDRAYKARDEA